jgi:Tfp pilus assembly protein PilN
MPARKFIKVNLLPKDAFETSFLGKFLKWSLTAGRAMVVLTEFVVILAFASRFWFDKKLNDLREANDFKQTTIQSYVETEEQMRGVLTRQKAVSVFLSERLKTSEGVGRLRLLLPGGTVLSQVNFLKNGVGIAGMAGSEQALAQTINAMKSYQDVERVEIKKIEFDQKKGGVEFEIISQFKEKKK